MRTNHRARVIMIRDEKALFIRRNKGNEIYFVLPGGGVESDETPEQAAIREAKEELGVTVTIDRHLTTFENKGNIEHYYIVTNQGGELRFKGDDHFDKSIIDAAEWIPLASMQDFNILPEKIKNIIQRYKAQ